MKNGYIIELDSKTFPGYNCYITLLGVNKDFNKPAHWGEYLMQSGHMCLCVQRSRCRKNIGRTFTKRIFIDPKDNHELASRLCGARIIPIQIEGIKQN